MSALEFNRRGIRNVECWCSEKEEVSLSIEYIIASLLKSFKLKFIINEIYKCITLKNCEYEANGVSEFIDSLVLYL